MSAGEISSPIEEELCLGRTEEDESTVQNLGKASSDVTAALFALELIKESNTPRAEIVKASKLLCKASEELKKALDSRQR
jgi:hypothetical protein